MQEEWRPVAGWEDLYEVSSLGRVRSLDREGFTRGDSKRLYKGRVLKPYPMVRSGYLSVRLSQAGHPKKLKKVHRLVAEAFIPNPEGHPLVRHLNDKKEDNRRENLAWGTAKDNNQDRFRNGYRPHRPSHCKRGHELSGDNERVSKTGKRNCRKCSWAYSWAKNKYGRVSEENYAEYFKVNGEER